MKMEVSEVQAVCSRFRYTILSSEINSKQNRTCEIFFTFDFNICLLLKYNITLSPSLICGNVKIILICTHNVCTHSSKYVCVYASLGYF